MTTTNSTEPTCPKCGSAMKRRTSKFGPFYGCTSFPNCRGTRPIVDEDAPLSQAVANGHTAAEAAARPERKAVVGSPEQEAIWHEIVNGKGHVVVNALAGSGKSFTCREAMHRVDHRLRVLYLAFNKSIVQEFKADAPANAEVATLNSLGHRVCMQAFPGLLLDADKVSNILGEVYQPKTQAELESSRTLTSTVEKLVALCQGYLMDGTDSAALLDLAAKHEVELTSDVQAKALKLVPQLLQLSKERTSVINFNDQLWLPIALNLPMPKYDLVFIDEAQDLNPCQHQLVLRLLADNGRAVIVGDTNQAIYGFRGSDTNSIANMSKLLASRGPVVSLALTVTRRCGKKIVAEAARYVPTIKAMPDAVEGEIIDTDTEAAASMYKPGDMVVCRCNAPLTGVAYQLIRRGVKAVIRGRDIGQGLVAVIKKLRASSVNEMLTKLDRWQTKEINKVAGTKRETAVAQQVTDRADCIRALAEDCEHLTDVIARIESIFANFEADGAPRNAVVMSSIHRAKGLEADRLFWLLPSISIKTQQEWQHQQEKNLRYVAITRAKKQLVLVEEPTRK